jgi:Ca2+-binding RTX toxin-like protein
VGEFNGDGGPDLAVADPFSGNVLVLLGSAGANFTAPATVASGADPVSVAVGDFNGDGDPDLAVTNVNLSRVSVYSAAPGAPSPPRRTSPSVAQTSVVAADFNGDGKPDLAATKFNTDNVAVLLNSTVTNQVPVAAGDAFSTAEDTVLTVTAPGVLGNDADPEGEPLTAVLVTGPSHGSLMLNANGSFSYTRWCRSDPGPGRQRHARRRGGHDLLCGGEGNDTLSSGGGDDTLVGSGGNDVLNDDDGGVDLLSGADGNDILSGGGGDDSLAGAAGDDRLTGGMGADRFSGGPGNDRPSTSPPPKATPPTARSRRHRTRRPAAPPCRRLVFAAKLRHSTVGNCSGHRSAES